MFDSFHSMMETSVDIDGIDKVYLLEQLWYNTSPNGFNKLFTQSFKKEEAEKIIAKREYIDYFCGHPIKCDLSGKVASTRLYNRDSQKTFEDVVKDIRKLLLC